MTTPEKINFDDYYSFLCVYAEGELVDYYQNDQLKNEFYLDTFQQLQFVDDPSNIVLTYASEEHKQIVQMIRFDNKEGLDKVSLKIYDSMTMQMKHPEVFMFDDV